MTVQNNTFYPDFMRFVRSNTLVNDAVDVGDGGSNGSGYAQGGHAEQSDERRQGEGSDQVSVEISEAARAVIATRVSVSLEAALAEPSGSGHVMARVAESALEAVWRCQVPVLATHTWVERALAVGPPDGQGSPRGCLAVDSYQARRATPASRFAVTISLEDSAGRELPLSVHVELTPAVMKRFGLEAPSRVPLVGDPVVLDGGGALDHGPLEPLRFVVDMDGRDDQVAWVEAGRGGEPVDDGSPVAVIARPLSGTASPSFDRTRLWLIDRKTGERLVALGEGRSGFVYVGELLG